MASDSIINSLLQEVSEALGEEKAQILLDHIVDLEDEIEKLEKENDCFKRSKRKRRNDDEGEAW